MHDVNRFAFPQRALIVLAVLGCAAAIIGALLAPAHGIDAWRWMHWVCKPLATLLLLILAWRTAQPVSQSYRRRIVLGLLLCLLGDICLMLSPNLFVPGLACFAVAHVCLIAAFVSDVRFAARVWPWLLCLIFAALAAWVLWPSLAASMRLPVLVYVLLLGTMAGQACGRAVELFAQGETYAGSAGIAAVGALLFMLSDSLLAWDRFRHPLPLAALWVLSTYYAAIGLIACSVARQPRAT